MSPLRNLVRKPLLRALLCVALGLRALTPAGVMVSGDLDQGFEVQLCTVHGLQTLSLPGPGEPAEPARGSGSGHADPACPFSLAAGAALAPAAAPLLRAAASVVQIAERGTARNFVAAIQRAQSPRAPPVRLPA
ncbi:MAG: DUF2946 family protein [Gammaproteobacteria bacterium]|nr:DUF2946 family protein [Gammaproteobacteria bacterium]